MSINNYMTPKEVEYKQTYVDQYVPLPFEVMTMALEQKQKEYDTVDLSQKTQLAALLKSDAIRGQIPLRDAIINNYEKEIKTLNNSFGGDLSKAGAATSEIAMRIFDDLTRGNLYRYDANAKAAAAHNKSEEEKLEKELGKGGITHRGHGAAMNATYGDFDRGVESALKQDPHGHYSFNGIKKAQEFDYGGEVDAMVKGMKANGYSTNGWTPDGNGALLKTVNGHTTYVTSEEIEQVAIARLASHPGIQEAFNQGLSIGEYSPEELQGILADAVHASKVKHGFVDEKTTMNVKFAPKDWEADGYGGWKRIDKTSPLTFQEQGVGVTTPSNIEDIQSNLISQKDELATLDKEYSAGKSKLNADEYNAKSQELKTNIAANSNLVNEGINRYLDSEEGKKEWFTKDATGISLAGDLYLEAMMNYPEKIFNKHEIEIIQKEIDRVREPTQANTPAMLNTERKKIVQGLINEKKITPELDVRTFMKRINSIVPVEEMKQSASILGGIQDPFNVLRLGTSAKNESFLGGADDNLYYKMQRLNEQSQNKLNESRENLTTKPDVLYSDDKNSIVHKINNSLTGQIIKSGEALIIDPATGVSEDFNTWLKGKNGEKYTSKDWKSTIQLTDDVSSGEAAYNYKVTNKKDGTIKNFPMKYTTNAGTINFNEAAVKLLEENEKRRTPLEVQNYATGLKMKANSLFYTSGTNHNQLSGALFFSAKDPVGEINTSNVIVLSNGVKVKMESIKGTNGNITVNLLNDKGDPIRYINESGKTTTLSAKSIQDVQQLFTELQ